MPSNRGAAALVAAAAALAGCGLNVQSPDLFLITRTGQGQRLTVLVNDGGTVRCDGGQALPINDQSLIQARTLASGTLQTDAENGLRIRRSANAVYVYEVKLKQGTISFPDTAGLRHKELAQVEALAASLAQQPCQVRG